MTVSFIGLGSNMGDRENNLLQALAHIHKQCRILDYSSMFITKPIGYTNQDDFINMAVKVDASAFTPEKLLKYAKDIEAQMGRKKGIRWGPRPIDIDILFMEGITLKTAKLTIPHKELFNRLFVLVPLMELTKTLPIEGRLVNIEECVLSATDRREHNTDRGISMYKSKRSFTPYGKN